MAEGRGRGGKTLGIHDCVGIQPEAEAATDQKLGTLLRMNERALEEWGGVPEESRFASIPRRQPQFQRVSVTSVSRLSCHRPIAFASSRTFVHAVLNVVTAWVGSFGCPLPGGEDVPLRLALTKTPDVPAVCVSSPAILDPGLTRLDAAPQPGCHPGPDRLSGAGRGLVEEPRRLTDFNSVIALLDRHSGRRP